MRTLQRGILATIVAGVTVLAGCESMTPMGPSLVDQTMGDAHRENIIRMTENPHAVHENSQTPNVDSETAEVILYRYYEKQRQPATPRQMPSIIQIDAN